MENKRLIEVAVANTDKRIKLPVDEIKEWEVKSKTIMLGDVYLKTNDGVYGMNMKDYNEIFQS